ncbi:MAG: ABC transporter permease [Dehalococcoidia bacterium]|nr:ABC transporter permease [Dehalococcoidia bacterium]
MGQYILRRLLLAIPTLVVVSILVFSLVRLVPGDVVMARLSESGYVTPEQLAQMRSELGIDRNPVVQYLDWGSGVIRGDFGKSLWDDNEVLPTIVGRMGISMEIAVFAILTAVCIAIPLGVISAVRQNSWVDYVARLFAVTGLSLPDFWIATMLLLFLSVKVHWLPEFGWYRPWEHPWQNFLAIIFPALIVGYRFSAVSARMTRSAMLEVMREDYVRTARAKGLRDRTVVVKHALRNGLIPVITIMGSQVSFLLGGLVVLEQIFSLPGMGRYTYDAVIHRDYTVVQGTVMVMASVYILVNLAIDLTYALIDPRIRYS